MVRSATTRHQRKMRTLRWSAVIVGACCASIGVAHALGGVATVPGEFAAGATVDSRERFYGVIFGFYGVAWMLAARPGRVQPRVLAGLAAAMFVGGIARALSWAVAGPPHWFQLGLLAMELVVPVLIAVLLRPTIRRASAVTRASSWWIRTGGPLRTQRPAPRDPRRAAPPDPR